MVRTFRDQITQAFGPLSYNAAELPFRVVANQQKRIVETFFHQNIGVLMANPEVFLAWAEKLEAAAKRLGPRVN